VSSHSSCWCSPSSTRCGPHVTIEGLGSRITYAVTGSPMRNYPC